MAAGILMLSLCGCGDNYGDTYNVELHKNQQYEQKKNNYESGGEYYSDPVGSSQEEYVPEYAYVPVGSIYTFGSYPQTHSSDPIEWIVVECKDGDAMLVSRFALDSVSYHSRSEDVTWETSSVRKWLNSVFYKAAFSPEEQASILDSSCYPDGNPLYNVDAGNETTDKVFLLSEGETRMYFTDEADRLCKPTTYAIQQGAYQNPSTGGAWWWLRTPGYSLKDAASVNSDGSIDLDDGSVTSTRGTVRPAIWIHLPE